MLYKVAENDKYKLEIHTDDYADSPRDWDNLGKMVCWHGRYNLGDKHNYNEPYDFLYDLASKYYSYVDEENILDNMSNEDLLDLIENHILILPLYLYDHSGITMSTSSFSCLWDSGQVGWIYCEDEDIKREYGIVNEENTQTAMNVLQGEVKVYDEYLRGDVYGFKAFKKITCSCCSHIEYEEVDSCWGFLGEDCVDNGIIDHLSLEIRPLIDELKYA